MKPLISLVILLFSWNLNAQSGFLNESPGSAHELPGGVISGRIRTADQQPAAYVSVYLKESNKTTITDENGYFIIKNLKEGTYTLEISMVGLQSFQKTVVLDHNETENLEVVLPENAGQLAEVVVSSGRRLNTKVLSIGKLDVSPMEIPQSMAIVGQGQIRGQQAQRLSDVMKNVNGVYLATTRASTQESFSARGYAFGNNNLFKNGARVNPGAMPEMSALERVEVLKGSAAILFGQVAPGGVVNMVTKAPKFQNGGELSLRLGSNDLVKPSFDLYGPVSSVLAYRVNGTFESSGSFRDQVRSKRYYVNPSFLFRLGNKTELLASADYLHHHFTPDFGIGSLDNTKIPDVPRSRFMGTAWQYNKTQQVTSSLELKHVFNAQWKLNSLFSFQDFDRDYFAVERIQAAANGDWTRPLGRILSNEVYYTGQLNVTGKFSTGFMKHHLLTGLDADRSVTTNNDFSFRAVSGLPAGSYDRINILDPGKYIQRTDLPEANRIRRRTAPVTRFGAYVQDLVQLTPHWNFLAGIRWSVVETAGIDSLNLVTGNSTVGVDRKDQAFSPRAGIVYKPTSATSFFISYSSSFVVNSGQDIEGNALAPSLVDQYEAGVKNDFWNGLLSANITFYRITNNNLAQTAPYLKDGTPNNSTNIKMLTGQTTSDGMELDLEAHPIKGLDVTAGYSYNFMRYTRTDTTLGSFKTGERLVNNPAHTANGSLQYQFSGKTLRGLKLGASIVYIGDRFGGWNTDVIKTGPVQYRSRIFAVEGFTTIDLSAGYTYKKITLLAKVSNLTNTLNYYVHENYSINPIPPTQVVGTLSYKF